MVDVIAFGTAAVHNGLTRPLGDLTRCAVEALHHNRQDHYWNSGTQLLRQGIPRDVLFQHVMAYGTVLNGYEQAKIYSFLLNRRPLADAPSVFGQPLPLNPAHVPNPVTAMDVVVNAHIAYNALNDERKAQVNAYLLKTSGIPKNAFVRGSVAYNRLVPRQQYIVDVYTPGTKAHDELYEYNKKAHEIVTGRIRTEDNARLATRSLIQFAGQFCKVLPVPILGDLVGEWIEEKAGRRYPDFNPYRVEKYIEIKSGKELEKKIAWEVRQVVKGAKNRFQELLDGTVGQGGNPALYPNLGGFLGDQAIAQELRRMLFNKQAEMSNMVFQMQHSIQKMYTACHDFEKYLDEHIRELIRAGHDEKTIYKMALDTFLGKMMSEAWECEPIIFGGRHASAPQL